MARNSNVTGSNTGEVITVIIIDHLVRFQPASPPRSRVKSCRGFLMSVEPLSESAESTRIKLWQGKFGDAQPFDIVGEIKEQLTTGVDG